MNSQKKLKLILASLKDRELNKFFEIFSSHFPNNFKKSVRQISFNCYESVCEFGNKIVSGYGKNASQAYINSVRTLVQLFTDDVKMHEILKQSLKLVSSNNIGSANLANFQSEKRQQNTGKQTSHSELPSNSTAKSSKSQSIHASMKPVNPYPAQKKQTLKEQIFEYLNLDNLKISNPNVSKKTKVHQKYMNQSSTDLNQNQQENGQSSSHTKNSKEQLSKILAINKELEKKLQVAKIQNQKLRTFYQNQKIQNEKWKSTCWVQGGNIVLSQNQNTKSKGTIKDIIYPQKKPRDSHEPLKPRTNDFLNMSHDVRLRSASVDPGQSETQKYSMQKSIKNMQVGENLQKKIHVPKLNLQVLPNYHGKSNKSLNQSLMEIYQKTHK